MCVRVYAVTQKNKWIAGAHSVVVAAGLGFGMFLVVEVLGSLRKFPNRFFVGVGIHIGRQRYRR
jgi:hypothetical protein